MARQPSKPTKNGVLSFLASAAKFAFQGAVVYLAVTALQGQHGKERLKEDFHAVTVRLLFSVCKEYKANVVSGHDIVFRFMFCLQCLKSS